MAAPDLTSPKTNIPYAILHMTFFLVPGMLSLVFLNLTDTYFVARLGTEPLTGISFTFPIVFLFGQATVGIGLGLTTSAAAALGRARPILARSQSSLAVSLSLIISTLLVPFLLLFTKPVLRLLGAEGEALQLANNYMIIWFIGLPFFTTSIISNAAIRATGDTWPSSLPMLTAAIINVALDPLLIFGLFFFPPLGISGAAIATISSRFIAFILSLYFLRNRCNLLARPSLIPRHIIYHLRAIFRAGLPSAVMKSVLALSITLVTIIIASFSSDTVAAYGVGSRLQAFAVLPAFALSIAVLTFTSQNYAARQYHRIRTAFRFTHFLSITWGLICFAVLAIFAHPIANLFTDDAEVYRDLVDFLHIAPIGYAPLAIVIVSANELIGIDRPILGASISLFKHIFLYSLFIYLGGLILGTPGLFIGMVATNYIVGIAALFLLRHLMPQPHKLP